MSRLNIIVSTRVSDEERLGNCTLDGLDCPPILYERPCLFCFYHDKNLNKILNNLDGVLDE